MATNVINPSSMLAANASFEPVRNPVTADYLREQGLGEAFVNYMSTWGGFVEG
ncbi:hypothetical protein [Candidatus Litorirhabdus singularis]|uniref:hypothetical protein n=1 Tax=Candidatus Litorirhabdus singularis TaxID=2518993 RepID=UPI002431DD43|nr:hypothetical protein [Candidatus Litorirhabdus singularis]